MGIPIIKMIWLCYLYSGNRYILYKINSPSAVRCMRSHWTFHISYHIPIISYEIFECHRNYKKYISNFVVTMVPANGLALLGPMMLVGNLKVQQWAISIPITWSIVPWEMWKKIWRNDFQDKFYDWFLNYLSLNCPQATVTGPHWW